MPKLAPPKKKQLVHLDLEQTLLDQVDNFQFTNRIRSRAEALRGLIRGGLRMAHDLGALAPEVRRER